MYGSPATPKKKPLLEPNLSIWFPMYSLVIVSAPQQPLFEGQSHALIVIFGFLYI